MTERIQRLVMQAFRGVPGRFEIDLEETGKSIAVFGDNGTGKSTIADALEWYLTGNLELLSHEGRQHAVRHLGGDEQCETSVELITTGSLGGKAVHPETRDVAVSDVAGRETFLLRGRTLADFINKTKTEKWKALAEILGLDAVDGLRQDLQRARNELKKEAKAAEEKLATLSAQLGSDTEAVFATLRELCTGVGVAPPDTLERVADPAWFKTHFGAGQAAMGREVRMESLVAEVTALRLPAPDEAVLGAWNDMVASRGELSRLALLREADSYLEQAESVPAECPLCGQDVDRKAFAGDIKRSLLELKDSVDELEASTGHLQEVIDALASAERERVALRETAGKLALKLPPVAAAPAKVLTTCLRECAPIDASAVSQFLEASAAWDKEISRICAESAPKAPAEREERLVMLGQICRQIGEWLTARKSAHETARALDLAEQLLRAYQQRQKEQLTGILEQISSRVASIYGRLHHGEGLERVSVEPWTAKGIELAIEFHGSRQRPPHGVLSESHLNSLAIALFLAMAETFNERLRFLVLDDVINSFDLEHRGQLAELLASEFADWQLIVLTHDHQFYDHLARRSPSWKRLELTSWCFDEGPRSTAYGTGGLLGEARQRLEGGDVNGAATKSRRALEEVLQEVCEGLAAPLPFRRGAANDRREIGQLLDGLRRGLKKPAKELGKQLEPLLKNLEADVAVTLNVEAHASRGRAASAEVASALDRIEELDGTWSCPSCSTRIWFKGTPDAGSCKCGKSRFPPVPAT